MPRLSLVALALGLTGCLAHFPRPDEPLEFMERTYVGIPIGADQVFEADPALHVVLWNGLDRPDVWERGGAHATVAFSFLATVRMYDEASTPVRTPDYEPRLKLQLFWIPPPPVRAEPESASGRGAMFALELLAAHHSNGQKGCALADHLRGTGFSDFDCVPLSDPPSTSLNLVDGSFTRHYLGANAFAKLSFSSRTGGTAAGSLSAGGGIEWNVPCRFAGCIEAPMRARYGEVLARWRVEGDALVVRGMHRRVPGLGLVGLDARLRGTVSGSVHLGVARGGLFGDVAAELAYVPRTARGLGVGPFVRYHRGHDYLNIRFEERLDTWLVGVVIDPSPPARP